MAFQIGQLDRVTIRASCRRDTKQRGERLSQLDILAQRLSVPGPELFASEAEHRRRPGHEHATLGTSSQTDQSIVHQ